MKDHSIEPALATSYLLSSSLQLLDQILSLVCRKVSSADLFVSKPLFGDGHP